MSISLTPNEARVAYELIDDHVNGREFDLEKSDMVHLLALTGQLRHATMGNAEQYRRMLLHQGVEPKIVEQHVKHRFG